MIFIKEFFFITLGMLFENAAAQALVSNSFTPFYYSWSQENETTIKKYEIDFIIFKNGKTIPFEVKSRNVSSKESLLAFAAKFPKRIGNKYIVWIKQLTFVDNFSYLPYYMLPYIK